MTPGRQVDISISKPPAAAPTRVRKAVVWFGAAIAFLSFLDRAAISQSAPAISKELHLSPAQMGLAFSAFGFSYAAFELPSGWLCDWLGARLLLTRVILLWSLFTATTGTVWNFSSLFVTRLMFGAGESGCFPALASVYRRWLPRAERGSAEGIKSACARWGAAIAPPLIALLYRYLSWRQVFFVFGVLGTTVAAIFYLWYRDDPRDHPQVNAAELDLLPLDSSLAHARLPLRKLMSATRVWALGAQWFSHYYGFYFYITWLPIYLYQVRHLDLRHEALAAGLPLFSAGLGSLIAGRILSRLTARYVDVGGARRVLGLISYGGAAALLLLFTWISNPALAIVTLSLSAFVSEFSAPITWTTAMDIGGKNVGSVSGFMNTLGQMGGSVAPACTGFLLTLTSNGWNLTFYTSALICAAGALCWMFIDPLPLDLD